MEFDEVFKEVGDVEVYDNKEDAVECFSDWVVIGDKLYSRRWENE